nr:hypothetical protein [Tanacetum cinerariifolium]
RLRDEAASISSPPSQLPSASRREDRPEVNLPTQKRLGIALGPRYEVGESSSAAAARPAGGFRADYGFVATGAPVSIDTELGGYVREFETRVRQDMDEIYTRLDDEQTERQLLAGRLNMLFRDRRAHAYTRQLMKTDARMSREAWVRATDASDLVHGEKQMAPRRTTRSIADRETVNATTVTNAQLQTMIDQGVTAALAARDALRSTNGDDSHNSGTGVRRTERAARKCTYTDFLKCQPLPFKGTEGVASLSQWCERMESVFHINNCAAENHVKFATCTLHSVTLTWWNTHVQTVGHEAAYGMSWKTLMKMMTNKYCPRNEIRKLEVGESSSTAVARPAGGFRADYGFVATVDREIMRDPERKVGYEITDSWDEIVDTLQGAPVSTDTELGGYVREFETRVRQDTDEIYMRLDDEQTERQLLAGRLNMLFRDRRAHAYTRQLMETKARMSREAWVRATDASDLVHGEVMSLLTTVLGQMSKIKELQAADRRRQTVISELLRIDHRRSTEISELRTALQG